MTMSTRIDDLPDAPKENNALLIAVCLLILFGIATFVHYDSRVYQVSKIGILTLVAYFITV